MSLEAQAGGAGGSRPAGRSVLRAASHGGEALVKNGSWCKFGFRKRRGCGGQRLRNGDITSRYTP